MRILMKILMGILMEILMGILMMDSMGWPYDSSDCLLLFSMQLWANLPVSSFLLSDNDCKSNLSNAAL